MLASADLYDDLDVRALPVSYGSAVLVVDDDDAMRDLIALRLRLLGHWVETASSVPAAIGELEAHTIGAVVSDHGMPMASGLELLSYVRRRRLQIPFVLMTGALTPELERAALEGGAAIALDKGDLLAALPDLFFIEASRRRSIPARAATSQEIHRKQGRVGSKLSGGVAKLDT
jgi:DNA-binding NtrC family response regulator